MEGSEDDQMPTGRAFDFFRRAIKSLRTGFSNALSAMFSGIKDARTNFSYFGWFLKKDWQTFKRTHLSHYLAAALCILVTIREWNTLCDLLVGLRWPDPLGWLILIITLLTFIAALIERFGNKLSTSAQEIRFQFGARQLLEELEKLRDLRGSQTAIELGFTSFVQRLLDIAAKTFSASSIVDAGLMVKIPNKEALKLTQWSGGAKYDEALEIPIPTNGKFEQSRETGPAALAFKKNHLVYVPQKDRENPKEAWPFKVTQWGARTSSIHH